MDFYTIKEVAKKNGVLEVGPDFRVCRSKDLMIRGKSFYAIWDDAKGMWSTDEFDTQRLVDEEIRARRDELAKTANGTVSARYMSEFSSNAWKDFRAYMNNLSDNSHDLDESLTFANQETRREDYVSKKLPYPLEHGDISAYDEIIGTLYEPEERAKLEWAIGAVIAGDGKHIQKFVVLYGDAGAGKSTILNIIQKLFQGYYTTFDAKAMTGSNNAFSTEVFKSNPLVAIQHDGDLSRIEDNTKLNSIVSHEEMTMNEKYKPSYTSRANAFLFMATNRPVKITDSKSGVIRRLIDVTPSGNKLPPKRYQALMGQIDFELGAIAQHCLDVYRGMGMDYYNNYRPLSMMLQTDVFYNFVEAEFETFLRQDGVSLNQAYKMYKEYCDDALVEFRLAKHKFREELKNYFRSYDDRIQVDGERRRSWYSGFRSDKFISVIGEGAEDDPPFRLVLDDTESLVDQQLGTCKAQYANQAGVPNSKWADIGTVLSDLDTGKLHYVLPPDNHIVIDFDLRNEAGDKDPELNLEAASKWPPTYAEYSQGGGGIHLHYIYDGDITELSRLYSDGIEIKVFTGNSSLRRRLSKCNNIPFAHISSGLPLKEKKVINKDTVKSEKALRDLVIRNLKKEIHPATKPSIDFIKKILDDAYSSDLEYDLTDLYPATRVFAARSTNQAELCMKLVSQMKFKSEDKEPADIPKEPQYEDDRLVFFDTECFPNLFIVNWKFQGSDQVVRMINPEPHEIEALCEFRLVGFNCRKYDNHLLYARYMGYNNAQMYDLSQRIIANSPNATFREAYSLSYIDVYDMASKKQSLKKWEIELGIHHKELGLPWDQPVPEERWTEVAEYCDNDVIATEKVFEARRDDFTARKILAAISGLTVNDTNNAHSARIIFGKDRKPQSKFIYTDLSEMFPGYKYEFGKSVYRGEETGEGGYVHSEPGIHRNVALLDVASMHPTSIEELNLFGPYTERFSDLKAARVDIKHGDFVSARRRLEGALGPYLDEGTDPAALSYALKIIINSVYGMTSAKFENPFKDPRNVDNIVAKRGALFMIDLKHFVRERGFTVAHIKTDSIKIPNATPEIIEEVFEFGKKYGYNFEHEATYEKMCLVNDAVYIAKDASDGHWTATGAQFAEPVVFKRLFTHEPVHIDDLAQTKAVTTAMYLDFEDGGKPQFVGKVGSFLPVLEGCGGGKLLREKDGKFSSVTGTKGYLWKEKEVFEAEGSPMSHINEDYYRKLVDAAADKIAQYGDLEEFLS